MPNQFQVQNLVREAAGTTLFRVVDDAGKALALTRMELDADAVFRLRTAGVFDQALAKLQALEHEYLSRVLDGGQDEGDGMPWVTRMWVDGKPLSEQNVEEKEIRSLGKQFHNLLEDLGDYANAVDFDPGHILTLRSPDGELHSLFSIDYGRWFDDWAAGRPPGSGTNAVNEVRKLLEGLVVKQLQLPRKTRKESPIPFVEEKSPALTSYAPPGENRVAAILAWLGIAICLGAIAWLTWRGSERLKDNPRKEVPVWKGR